MHSYLYPGAVNDDAQPSFRASVVLKVYSPATPVAPSFFATLPSLYPMNTKLPRVIAKPLHSATSLRVTLEAPLAEALRQAQQTHPALAVNGRYASFSLVTRRALTLYLRHLESLSPATAATEQQTILQLA